VYDGIVVSLRASVVLCLLAIGCGRIGFSGGTGGTGGGGGGGGVADSPAACVLPTECPVGMTCTNQSCVQIPPSTAGLVAYWPFDGTFTDAVGGNDALCVSGQCPTSVPGVLGSAASFDGMSSCLSVASLGSWVSPMFTFSAWIQTNAVAGYNGPIVVHEEAVPGCPSPELGASNNGVGAVQNNTTGVHNQAWSAPIANAMSWHHVAVSWDGTAQTVFVDGACTCTNLPPHPPAFNGNQPFTIGCYPTNSPAQRYTGAIDEVRVYNRALANDEVAELYEAGGGAPPSTIACPATVCAPTPP